VGRSLERSRFISNLHQYLLTDLYQQVNTDVSTDIITDKYIESKYLLRFRSHSALE
jgi:hypothetical protein